MIKISRDWSTHTVYISTVAFGDPSDFYYTTDGDLFSIGRANTEIDQVHRLSYTKFLGNINDTWTSFADKQSLEDYLQDIFTPRSSFCPEPLVDSLYPDSLTHTMTSDITIKGHNFDSMSQVIIPDVVVNSVVYVNPNEIRLNVTTGTVNKASDVTVTNHCGQITATDGFTTELSLWNLLSDGNDISGLGIRVHPGMNILQDSEGMHFTGANPWSSWVKFEGMTWQRGQNKKLEWVFTSPTASMMVGIGSDATNETATAQYKQGETLAYFQNSSFMWGLYGNNGTVGSTGNQSNSASLGSFAAYKAVFESDGSNGGLFTLYGLTGNQQSDFDDTGNVLKTFAIGGSLAPDETNIMPFIIPRPGTQRFLAVKVTG